MHYMAIQLSCIILYILLKLSIVKLRELSFAAIIKPLRTQLVYERALSLAHVDRNLFVDDGLQIR